MNNEQKTKSALTLTEMTVVIATIVLLIGLGLPAVRALFNSFESQSSTQSMISTALASARAIAAQNQRYAGIRFQKTNRAEDPLEAAQYMIFVVQDPDMMAYGFRAVPGLKPIRLPETIGVMDLIRVNRDYNPRNHQTTITSETAIVSDAMISAPRDITDITTFSIVFSPAGKIVIHKVQVRNANGFVDSTDNQEISLDDVFNKMEQVNRKYQGYGTYDSPPGAGMFYQDDYYDPDLNNYGDFGLGPEYSRSSFVIYEKDKFAQAYKKRRAWSDYLVKLVDQAIYINPYTGTIINP